MTLEHTESDAELAEKNRRLQALVAELLKVFANNYPRCSGLPATPACGRGLAGPGRTGVRQQRLRQRVRRGVRRMRLKALALAAQKKDACRQHDEDDDRGSDHDAQKVRAFRILPVIGGRVLRVVGDAHASVMRIRRGWKFC